MKATNPWVRSEEEAKVVRKPHGREVWLEVNDRYSTKRVYMNKGTRASFHFHRQRHETNYIISGEAEVWLENDEGVVETMRLKANDYYVVLPGRKHRLIAITDLLVQEAATPEMDDVVRLEDDYNRGDGKIEEEHQAA